MCKRVYWYDMDFKIGEFELGSEDCSFSITSEEFGERALSILEKDSNKTYARFRSLARSVFLIPHAYISMAPKGHDNIRIRIGEEIFEIPRKDSFCGCVLDHVEILVVQNAIEDDRFRNNPMVKDEMHVRFYAGVPLVGATGDPLGTLCIMDTIPRTFEESRLSILKDLGSQIVEHLETEVRNELMSERLGSKGVLTDWAARRFKPTATDKIGSVENSEDSNPLIKLNEEVEKIIGQYSCEAGYKGIKLVSTVTDRLAIRFDRDLLLLILRTTIFNGLKYCIQGGSVKIEAWKSARNVIVSILDTGAGMEPERAQELLSDEHPVSGISVCKRILEENHGQIDILSEKGMGTTVTLKFPL